MECNPLHCLKKLLICNRFRWVHCQLETLRKCRTTGALSYALTQLPKNLDETYDRILNNISEDDRTIAHRVLQLLVVCERPMTIPEVATVVTGVDCENGVFDDTQQLLDPFDILEICSSLVESTRY